MPNEIPGDATVARRAWEEEAIGPVRSWAMAGISGLGAVPIFKVRWNDDLESILKKGLSGHPISYQYQWALFKESNEVSSEYLSLGLEVEWVDPRVLIRLLFPMSEFKIALKSCHEARGTMGIAPEGKLNVSKILDVTVPDEVLLGALQLLGEI